MAKRLHPADEYTAKVIAAAVEWTSFTQAGGRITNRHGSEAEASADAQQLANKFGRPALVYAINADGRSALAATIRPTKQETTTMSDELTTTQIAQLTAVLTGGGAKRSNSKAAAASRFIKIAAEKGIPAPADILKLSFDDARAALNKPEKPAKAPKATKVEKPAKAKPDASPRKRMSKRAAVLEAVEGGKLPEPPDFSATTHARYRDKLAQLVAMAKAGDIKGLKAVEIKPYSSSPKAMDRYRNLCVTALEARK